MPPGGQVVKKLHHKWKAIVVCSRCGLAPERAGKYCHPGQGEPNGQDADV
jgi:hypothetical protein